MSFLNTDEVTGHVHGILGSHSGFCNQRYSEAQRQFSARTAIPGLFVYASCNKWLEMGSQLAGEELLIHGLPLPCFVSEILRDFVTCHD